MSQALPEPVRTAPNAVPHTVAALNAMIVCESCLGLCLRVDNTHVRLLDALAPHSEVPLAIWNSFSFVGITATRGHRAISPLLLLRHQFQRLRQRSGFRWTIRRCYSKGWVERPWSRSVIRCYQSTMSLLSVICYVRVSDLVAHTTLHIPICLLPWDTHTDVGVA